MSRQATVVIAFWLASGSVFAQTEWQELTAAKLQKSELGTTEYLYAILERTAAMLNHDKEQAIEFAELALKEARRQKNPSAEAVCYLQRSIAIAEMEGLRASEQAYERAISLFNPSCSAELRLFYYSHLFYRDRLVKSPGELLAISQKMQKAVDELDDKQLALLGELSLFEQRAIASPPTKEDSAPLRKLIDETGLNFVALSLDCQELLRGKERSPKETVRQLAPLAKRAKEAQFRPVQVLVLLRLVDAAAKLRDLTMFERYSEEMHDAAMKLHRTDWLALALCAKADLALARKDSEQALTLMDQSCNLLPAVDMGNVRQRVQRAAVKVYLATDQKQRLVEFTNTVFSRDDHIQSRRLQQRLQEFSRQLEEAQKATKTREKRVEALRIETEKLVAINESLELDRNEAESQNSMLQRMMTLGFVMSSLLAVVAILSRQRLRKTHVALQAEVETNQRNLELQRTMETKISQAERMESLGALAGGIAHDLNNLLVGVLCNAELLENPTIDETTRSDCTTGIIRSAMAAADLSQKMLSYAGRVPSSKHVFDLNELVSSMSPLLRSGLNLKHELQLAAGQPLTTKMDGTQMEQVMMNLATNASVAIKDQQDGRLVVRTGTETIDEVASDPTLYGTRTEGGKFVYFEFHDNGTGIEQHRMSRIFEPFYSSREMGQGLGLAVVYGHVVAHDGLIRCQSSAEEGTRFRILLPQLQQRHKEMFGTTSTRQHL